MGANPAGTQLLLLMYVFKEHLAASLLDSRGALRYYNSWAYISYLWGRRGLIHKNSRGKSICVFML